MCIVIWCSALCVFFRCGLQNVFLGVVYSVHFQMWYTVGFFNAVYSVLSGVVSNQYSVCFQVCIMYVFRCIRYALSCAQYVFRCVQHDQMYCALCVVKCGLQYEFPDVYNKHFCFQYCVCFLPDAVFSDVSNVCFQMRCTVCIFRCDVQCIFSDVIYSMYFQMLHTVCISDVIYSVHFQMWCIVCIFRCDNSVYFHFQLWCTVYFWM